MRARWPSMWSMVALVVAVLPMAVAAAPGADRERRLHLAGAEASSFLVNDWNRFQENYLPLYVGDDDPRTAWNLKTEGIGEWLRVKVTPMQEATRVRMKIRNGYQKSQKLFEANSRARALTVVLLPSKKTVDVELADKSGWQEVTVEQPAGALEDVELRVKSVYPGKKYDDLCLSDLQLFVTAQSSDNPAFEKQRFEKILAWKKERVAAAKLFQTELGKRLPIAPQYLVQWAPPGPEPSDPKERWVNPCPDGGDDCYMALALGRAVESEAKGKHAAGLRTALDLARAKFANMTAVRVTVRDKRPLPRVDGLCTPNLEFCSEDPCEGALPLPMPGQLGYLEADALALTEQSGLPTFADARQNRPPQCQRSEAATFAWAARDPAPAGGGAGRLRALLLVSCALAQGREGRFPAARSQLLVYDADGRLEVISGSSYAAALDWDKGSDGPKLARATITSGDRNFDLTVEAATAVVATK
jgi:hypothetical protein